MSDVEEPYHWVAGDGGPLIVLQAGAVPQWQGAANFENSLMQGGTVETDYDVICRYDGNDGAARIHRYGRDMLVLNDSSFGAFFVPSPLGEVVILQWFGWNGEVEELVEHVTASPPSRTFPLRIEDPILRLLVGAQDGEGGCYGFSEAPIMPGLKECAVYVSDAALMMILRPIPPS